MPLLLTPEERVELARPPLERAQGARAAGDAIAARDIMADAARAWRRGADGYVSWLQFTFMFMREHVGDEAVGGAGAAMAATREAWQPWARELVDTSDLFETRAARLRRRHDQGLDEVCAVLSHVYRAHGIDVLEQSIRAVGERTLLAWMPKDIDRPPEVRIRTWAAMLHGNFAEFTIDEDDETFVITQDPCGSCGRQLECGAFPGPLDHATVTEVHPITFEHGDVPIYRTHVAVMHFLMPDERIGVPWPVVACPPGTVAGPCRITLYKDPRNPAARRDADALRGARDA